MPVQLSVSSVNALKRLRGRDRPSIVEKAFLSLYAALFGIGTFVLPWVVFRRHVQFGDSLWPVAIPAILSSLFAFYFVRRLTLSYDFDAGVVSCRVWNGKLLWTEDLTELKGIQIYIGRGFSKWILQWPDHQRSAYFSDTFERYLLMGRSRGRWARFGKPMRETSTPFSTWWDAPATRRDRVLGAVVGGLGCFWIGGLCRLFLGTFPVSLHAFIEWGLAAGAVGVLLGVCFPKAITCVCFPFSTFSVN